MNEPETIRTILEKTKTIAVVGLSDNAQRPAFRVSKYMQHEGYRIIPIHPDVSQALGQKAYPSLDAAYAAEGVIDLVNVFRASEYVPEIVKDVMRLKIPYIWLQEGVCHDEAAGWALARRTVAGWATSCTNEGSVPRSVAGGRCPFGGGRWQISVGATSGTCAGRTGRCCCATCTSTGSPAGWI